MFSVVSVYFDDIHNKWRKYEWTMQGEESQHSHTRIQRTRIDNTNEQDHTTATHALAFDFRYTPRFDSCYREQI